MADAPQYGQKQKEAQQYYVDNYLVPRDNWQKLIGLAQIAVGLYMQYELLNRQTKVMEEALGIDG